MGRLVLFTVLFSLVQFASASELEPKVLKRVESAVVRIGVCSSKPFAKQTTRYERQYLHNLCGGVKAPGQENQPHSHTIGTGFLINKRGYIVTNHHIAKGGTTIIVYDGSPSLAYQRVAKVVWASRAHDVAILKVTGLRIAGTRSAKKKGANDKRPLRHPVALAIPEVAKLQKGAPVWSLGFPTATVAEGVKKFIVDPVLGTGNVAAINVELNPLPKYGTKHTRMIDHTARVNPGNSGGPLIDACGRVIAVNQSKSIQQAVDQTYLSVNISYVIDHLEVARIAHRNISKPCLIKGKPPKVIKEVIDRTKTVVEKIENPLNQKILIAMSVVIAVIAMMVFWLFIQKRRQPTGSYSELIRREFSRVIGRSPSARRSKRHNPAPDNGRPISAPQSQSNLPPTQGLGPRTKASPKSMDSVLQGYLIGYNSLANIAVKLTARELVIGREPSCEFTLDIKTIGRRHLRITWEKGHFYLEDLDSSNGTFFEDGTALTPRQRYRVAAGDKFYLASPDLMFSLIPPQLSTSS